MTKDPKVDIIDDHHEHEGPSVLIHTTDRMLARALARREFDGLGYEDCRLDVGMPRLWRWLPVPPNQREGADHDLTLRPADRPGRGVFTAILATWVDEAERAYAKRVLFDGLEQPHAQRPVIVTTTARYVVWVDDDHTIERLRDYPHDILDGHPPAIDGWIDVQEPDDHELACYVYDEPFGPDNAPIEGPWWECTSCGRGQPPGSPRPRGHNRWCTEAAATTAGGDR